MDEQEQTLEQRAAPVIEKFEVDGIDLVNKLQGYAVAEEGLAIKDIDEAYRKAKATARELNALAKEKRKKMVEGE